jgi:hypothetical protein
MRTKPGKAIDPKVKPIPLKTHGLTVEVTIFKSHLVFKTHKVITPIQLTV